MGRIIGGHTVIYSRDADADRAFLRDVMGLPHADAGGGWLIFALPPSEAAVHPSRKNNQHEFYLLCDDIRAWTSELRRRKIRCSPIRDRGWGLFTRMSLPGGGTLGVYEPCHPRPPARSQRRRSTQASKAPTKTRA